MKCGDCQPMQPHHPPVQDAQAVCNPRCACRAGKMPTQDQGLPERLSETHAGLAKYLQSRLTDRRSKDEEDQD